MDEETFDKTFAECANCGKEFTGPDGPEDCPWCFEFHCRHCYCPVLEAWEERQLAEVEGGEEPDPGGARMTVDDIPCVTCDRAPKDGVEFVFCERCTYWHCRECGCPSPARPEDEEDSLAFPAPPRDPGNKS